MTVNELLKIYKKGDVLYNHIISRNCRIPYDQEKNIIKDLVGKGLLKECTKPECPRCMHPLTGDNEIGYDCTYCDSYFTNSDDVVFRTSYIVNEKLIED